MGVHPEGIDVRTMAVCCAVTYRQLDYWDRQGTLHPSVRGARGQGRGTRLYSPDDARVGRALGILARHGATHTTMRHAATHLRRVATWTGHVYITTDGTVHLAMPPGGAWCIDLAWCHRHPCCNQGTLAGVA